MSTITSESPLVSPVVGSVDGPAHPVSDMIDPTEILYRLTVEEYEQIAGFLNDDRVELIDGYLVKKMNKNPPHVIGRAPGRPSSVPTPWLARPTRRACSRRATN